MKIYKLMIISMHRFLLALNFLCALFKFWYLQNEIVITLQKSSVLSKCLSLLHIWLLTKQNKVILFLDVCMKLICVELTSVKVVTLRITLW